MSNSYSKNRTYYDNMMHTHDSSLPAWGPYSKQMAGIAHIHDKERGAAFNLSVFPVIYRGRSTLPTECTETNFHPWHAKEDLSAYTYRFELEWKDKVFCDITYQRAGDDLYAIKIECHNNSDLDQMIGIHYLASMQFPKDGDCFRTWVKPDNTCVQIIDGVHYDSITPAVKSPRDHLVFDGRYYGEELISGAVHGRVLGNGFGSNIGDKVSYKLPNCLEKRVFLRVKGKADFELSGDFKGILSINSDDFSLYEIIPVTYTDNTDCLLTLKTFDNSEGVKLDCIALCKEVPSFIEDTAYYIPEIKEEGTSLQLKYADNCLYTIIRTGEASSFLREIFSSDWERKMNDGVMNHVSHVLNGDGKAHYTDLFERPIFLAPHEEKTLYAFVMCGDKAFDKKAAISSLSDFTVPICENPYEQSIRIMKAVMLTNIVFPVYVQGEHIRHFTPGKWWDSLYTWDSGFIGIGLTAINTDRALETLNCYLTEPGNPHAAFIHHGSPVPVQVYLYKSLFDLTQDKDFLMSFYPRMKQYYEFLLGRAENSDTRRLSSGLINTFSYFYNSGGWDDYPPQFAVHIQKLTNKVSPCIGSVHAIVFGRILKHVSHILGLENESIYDKDIASLSDALNNFAFDKDSGYYSYVTHDDNGQPDGIFRFKDGTNYNMGLDGAEPTLAGICSAETEERLLGYVMSEDHMWTRCGISTVDKSATYFRNDGYWNGAVWMPHQWFMYLEMLAANKPENAVKIAMTALDTWRRETDATYNCYEHFIVESGRGAGWHHFSGLSAPVLKWYNAMFTPGTIETPVEAFVTSKEFTQDYSEAKIEFDCEGPRKLVTVLINMPYDNYKIILNGCESKYNRFGGVLAIQIPGNGKSNLYITRK